MDPDEEHPPGAVMELAANCVRFVLQKTKVELDFTPDGLAATRFTWYEWPRWRIT